MDKTLKILLEDLAVSSDDAIGTDKALKDKNIGRIVLVLKDVQNLTPNLKTLILNHTQNRLLNQHYISEKKIPIVQIPHYNEENGNGEWDWPIYIGKYLEEKGFKLSV
tara:strand:- start:146 stop:469 length:324 start_codon:yes stop_codon:yes gene_type:complete